jgi:acetyl-CoA carboxylase biotin carboxyl carrier protein
MTRRERVGELVGLIDRLEDLMKRSALAEVEVEVGDTTVILRSPAAVAPPAALLAAPTATTPTPEAAAISASEPEVHTGHQVLAPLTGVFYLSPSPDAEPYIREGVQVNTGQVIGLIEAMKLFNEIKSDVTGTVRRLMATDGDLVKAKQALIEVDPS